MSEEEAKIPRGQHLPYKKDVIKKIMGADMEMDRALVALDLNRDFAKQLSPAVLGVKSSGIHTEDQYLNAWYLYVYECKSVREITRLINKAGGNLSSVTVRNWAQKSDRLWTIHRKKVINELVQNRLSSQAARSVMQATEYVGDQQDLIAGTQKSLKIASETLQDSCQEIQDQMDHGELKPDELIELSGAMATNIKSLNALSSAVKKTGDAAKPIYKEDKIEEVQSTMQQLITVEEGVETEDEILGSFKAIDVETTPAPYTDEPQPGPSPTDERTEDGNGEAPRSGSPLFDDDQPDPAERVETGSGEGGGKKLSRPNDWGEL